MRVCVGCFLCVDFNVEFLCRRSHCSNMTKAGYPKDVVSRASSSIHCILNHCACVSWSTDIPSHVHEQLLNFIYNVYW